MSIETNCSRNCRALRRWIGISQADLARQTGLGIATVHRLEATPPQAVWTIAIVEKVAVALGCTPQTLQADRLVGQNRSDDE